jgi:hypothetical protein
MIKNTVAVMEQKLTRIPDVIIPTLQKMRI